MCRGKVAPRSEENMQNLQASSLIAELEEKEFLGPDNLNLLKDLLKDVKEWAILDEVEKFESKRKEYFDLLEQIIRALEELNDLERLVSICKGKIPLERQGNICDVRALFEVLEDNSCLEINRLDILKEILAQTGKSDLLMTVKEFDERRIREDKFERRKGICRIPIVLCYAVGLPARCLRVEVSFFLSFFSFCLARAAEIVSTARDNLTGGKFISITMSNHINL